MPINDINIDGLGVDVELMSVPWYAQGTQDISAMYACCSYGKQYKELLATHGHLHMLYVVVRFCDTKFANSELKVYINFEKNYST